MDKILKVTVMHEGSQADAYFIVADAGKDSFLSAMADAATAADVIAMCEEAQITEDCQVNIPFPDVVRRVIAQRAEFVRAHPID